MMKSIGVIAGVLVLGACNPDLAVPNLNSPSAGGAATRSSVLASAQGLIGSARARATGTVRTVGIWGRESYDLRPQEPRPTADNLIGPRDPQSFGSGLEFGAYSTIVNIRATLDATDGVGNMTDQEKEGIRGWALTVEAFCYTQLALTNPVFGAPLEPPVDPNGELSPVATPTELFERALSLYDEAVTHLQAAGGEFAIGMPDGFGAYGTPSGMVKVNRALKARTLKYMGRWADVLTTLGQSFIDPNGDMEDGAWFDYDPGSGGGNPFFNVATDYIHPRIRGEAQKQADGSLDQRALDKTEVIPEISLYDIAVTEIPVMYPAQTSQFPWIKNEELLLMRAEANLATGKPAAALDDVNTVRQKSGKLPAIAAQPSDAALLDEILYNRLYSLLFEGGFAYLDAYQYGRLDQLPRALPNHVVFDRFNWPNNECLQRDMTDGPCGSVDGN